MRKNLTRRLLLKAAAIVGAAVFLPADARAAITLSGPDSASLEQGASTNLTLQLHRQGKPQPATFSISGVPPGVTASFKPTGCTPNCQTVLNLSAAPDTTIGDYSLIVRALT